ncbi:sigma-70 family RNA polymerase sigma factor [Microbacterium sp. cx-55]|uniref:RNA polymerase sigma factor n=1 Tax=Microbacterium sp. cx-55 TaxID=2875948 RepID=UPI001CBF4C4D|nr:sigma-70 family RNA polymerase sigma factor [Microbacterium sp. cx-55]MBZ4486564.1 sigma-70 family RNA polymerase sigma factor [Microbacterium sp. cx-55]UGB36468.1 sigma-70 family RNA polymerase sigma factor [Microbacterium sp. cx-55]
MSLSDGRRGHADETRAARIADIVRRESGSLLDYFARRTSSREDAADLLGDTLVIVWRRERAVPEDAAEARMWMFGVARRVLSQHRRSSGRRLALSERLGHYLRDSERPPESAETGDVRAAIAQLNEGDQEIIRLVYWDGFTLAEVAQLLAMNPATVRSRHARARIRLQGLLTPAVGEEVR